MASALEEMGEWSFMVVMYRASVLTLSILLY